MQIPIPVAMAPFFCKLRVFLPAAFSVGVRCGVQRGGRGRPAPHPQPASRPGHTQPYWLLADELPMDMVECFLEGAMAEGRRCEEASVRLHRQHTMRAQVQHECIPQAILGMDVICQAKSGMGKTVVFVLSSLQQIDPAAGQVAALVLCHTRELAWPTRYATSSRGSANICLN